MKAVTFLILAMLPKFYIDNTCGCFNQYYLVTDAKKWNPKIIALSKNGDEGASVGICYDIDDTIWNNSKDTAVAEPDSLLNDIIILKKNKNGFIATDGYYWKTKIIPYDKSIKLGRITYDNLKWYTLRDTTIAQPDSLLYLEAAN